MNELRPGVTTRSSPLHPVLAPARSAGLLYQRTAVPRRLFARIEDSPTRMPDSPSRSRPPRAVPELSPRRPASTSTQLNPPSHKPHPRPIAPGLSPRSAGAARASNLSPTCTGRGPRARISPWLKNTHRTQTAAQRSERPHHPFIEGDGTGATSGPRQHVLDAAARARPHDRVARSARRRKAFITRAIGCRRDDREIPRIPHRHQRPLTTPIGGGSVRSTSRCSRFSILRLLAPGAMVPVVPSPVSVREVDMVIFRENARHTPARGRGVHPGPRSCAELLRDRSAGNP